MNEETKVTALFYKGEDGKFKPLIPLKDIPTVSFGSEYEKAEKIFNDLIQTILENKEVTIEWLLKNNVEKLNIQLKKVK